MQLPDKFDLSVRRDIVCKCNFPNELKFIYYLCTMHTEWKPSKLQLTLRGFLQVFAVIALTLPQTAILRLQAALVGLSLKLMALLQQCTAHLKWK